jgi:hypothetical protein
MAQNANPPHPPPAATRPAAPRPASPVLSRIRTAALTLTALCLTGILAPSHLPAIQAAATPNPDAICARCHQSIYTSYERTNMAQGSGAAVSGILQGGFTHAPSGIDYKVFLRDGKAWMSYARSPTPDPTTQPSPQTPTTPLHGERQLLAFIGSGHRGRTYLYQQQGLWFEAPINYYGKKALWDMAPAYGSVHAMPDALPVDPNCLHCHATAIQPSLPQARNRFASEPFRQPGIGCSACHGDPAAHLANVKTYPGKPGILNPATLPPARRDSICLQCHLEGEAAIYRAGSSLASFQPGDELSGHVLYFVRAANATGSGRATSQYEALLHSACKLASGDKLTCTTCHDPHSSPTPAERVAWFRTKCLACHTPPALATHHHPEQQDCAVCHMPTRDTQDISHEQLTDHNIQATPRTSPPLRLTTLSESPDDLIPVGNLPAPDRELGLAYAQRALHGDRAAAQRALALLRKAEQAGAGANLSPDATDVPLHLNLALLDQLSGDALAARAEYRQTLAADPYEVTALGNLALLNLTSPETRSPETTPAAPNPTVASLQLLERAVAGDPSQTAAALNLAFIECHLGDLRSARQTLSTLALFNPDNPALRAFLATGDYAGQHCDLHPNHP